ncbi:MAG: CaiB/BaiF CoA-transferase family protein [Ferroplasma sp.]
MTLVIDATRLIPGGIATRIFSDLGFEVVKVEDTENGDYMRRLSPEANKYLNSGKKSISINLKKKDGLNIFYKLIKNADVFLESFRPGVVNKLKIGPDTLHKINPKLVYCSIYGYGNASDDPGHDINFTAYSGIDRVLPVQVADTGSALYADIMILQHLYAQDFSHIIINMSAVPELFNVYSIFSEHNMLDGSYPCYSIYETVDGKVALGCLEEKFWINFLKAMHAEDMKEKQFEADSRSKVQAMLCSLKSRAVIQMGKEYDFPASIVRLKNEVAAEMMPCDNAPLSGENTIEILKHMNFDENEINYFISNNIIKI